MNANLERLAESIRFNAAQYRDKWEYAPTDLCLGPAQFEILLLSVNLEMFLHSLRDAFPSGITVRRLSSDGLCVGCLYPEP